MKSDRESLLKKKSVGSINDDQEEVKKVETPVVASANTSKILRGYMLGQKRMFIWGTVALVGSKIGQLLTPLFVGEFIDLISNQEYEKIWTLCFYLLIVVLVKIVILIMCVQISSICDFFEKLLYELISERIAQNLRLDLYTSLINKDVEFFDSRKTGDLCKYTDLSDLTIVSRLGSDTAVIQGGLSTTVAAFIRGIVFVLISFVFLFIISWELTLTIVVSILPVIIFSIFFG